VSSEDRARRAERQLAVTQQITHIGSWEWTAATSNVTWSDELYRIYGFEPQSRDISFEFFVSCLHPDDRTRVQREVGRALETGGRFAYTERVVRPDGTVRVLDTIGEAVRDEGGRTVGLVGTCRDVTDDRRREDTIRLYADIVDSVQIGLSVFDVTDANEPRSFRLVTCNPAAERAAGRSLASAVGKPLGDIAPYALHGLLPNMLADVARDGRVREVVQERAYNPSLPDRSVVLKAFPLPGRRVGVAVEDITAWTRLRRLQAAAQRMLERIATGDPLPDVLAMLAGAIEETLPRSNVTIELVQPDAGVQTLGAVGAAREGHAAAPEGSPASATPIVATDGRYLGRLLMVIPEDRVLNDDERLAVQRAAYLAGLAIERSQMEDQLRELTAHLESIREDERTGIAREIHDELGQGLTALKMDLAWIGRRASGGGALQSAELIDKVRAMSEMTDGIIETVRRISAELRPGVLDDLGLLAAIEWQAQDFETRVGATCAVESNLGDEPLDRETSTAVFRIFQEALTNVTRHAQANHVDVHLHRSERTLLLEVHDDGRGIPPEALANPRSLGLLGIRERARRLGGTVHIEAIPAGGTIVSLEIPFERRRA
jgi:PAS domain S-box-containing protein